MHGDGGFQRGKRERGHPVHHAEYNLLIHSASTVKLLCSFVFVRVAGETADHAFIHFDVAGQLTAFVVLHGKSNAMEHEPSGLLSYAKSAMEFPRANSVLVVDDHPDGRKPLIQTERTFLKDSSGLEAELWTFVLAVALPDPRFLQILYMVRIAARAAHDAIRPAQFDHKLAAVFIVCKVDNRFSECGSECHESESSK